MNIIKLSPETQEYINTVKEQMETLGVITDTDRCNLDLMATQVELYFRALKDIEEKGLTCMDTKGRLCANPSFSVARSAMTQITALLKELSISTRQRRMLVKDDMVTEDSPISQLFDIMNQ